MSQPRQLDNPLYSLIRNEQIAAFNAKSPKTRVCRPERRGFSRIDLRALDAQGINFSNAYFRGTDLRGLDLRSATTRRCQPGACADFRGLLPAELTADEILMSVNFGTRLRYNTR